MCVKNQTGVQLKCDANHVKLNMKNMYADFNSKYYLSFNNINYKDF